MSCLMVNESIGDAFIDCVMPSFFTSIYLLADALFDISLLAILCPSSAVVGIFLYYTLVYRRAKKSHQERKILLQTRKRNGDFGREEKAFRQNNYKELNRRPSGLVYDIGEFTRRLLVSLNDGVVTLITYVSNMRLKKSVAVEITFSYKWCAMNKSVLHQGTMNLFRGMDSISVAKSEAQFNAKDGANDGHYSVRKCTIVPNPQEITRMVKASHMWWTAHDGPSNLISDSFVHQPSITAQSTGCSFRSDYSSARASQRELRATIFFDTGEALLRIWSNLLITAVHKNGTDYDWNVELFDVPASTLLDELRNIFDSFYPDGIPMSEVEKREACELFSKWIQGQDSSQSSGGMCLSSQMVPFKEFHDWFYDLSKMIHDLTSDRLLTHTLLLSHRSNAASADAVRRLNVVAPQHSNTIHKTYISVRLTPVITLPLKTMYTENPLFGIPSISRHSHILSGQHSIQDIVQRTDGNDHYSTYEQIPLEGRLPDSVNPMNNLRGSRRSFTSPQVIHEVSKSEDLYCTYPEGDSVENVSPSAYPQTILKGSPHNIRDLRDPPGRKPLKSIYPHIPR